VHEVATDAGLEIGALEIVDAPYSHDSAAKTVELARAGRAEALMKGSPHIDESTSAVAASPFTMLPLPSNSKASPCRSRSG
jgi:phosphate acetyltransferase